MKQLADQVATYLSFSRQAVSKSLYSKSINESRKRPGNFPGRGTSPAFPISPTSPTFSTFSTFRLSAFPGFPGFPGFFDLFSFPRLSRLFRLSQLPRLSYIFGFPHISWIPRFIDFSLIYKNVWSSTDFCDFRGGFSRESIGMSSHRSISAGSLRFLDFRLSREPDPSYIHRCVYI